MIAPPIASGITDPALPLSKNRFQVQEADTTTNASKIPVLFTVPCSVMVGDDVDAGDDEWALLLNVSALNAGLPERPNICSAL